jgi:peptidoglycan hydrolase-like protein with peptidoglycan-binding domain
MKLRGILAGAALASSILALPALAQTVAPLTYVQPLSPNAVRVVQEKLRAFGIYRGAADGVWGPDSAAALQRFQATHQLQVTGQLNQVTVTALGLDPAALLSPPPSPAAAAARRPGR